MMHWRQLLFTTGFALVPIGIWAFRVDPLLDRHDQALQAQISETIKNSSARKYIHERDQLQAVWAEFRPLAEIELENIGVQLNPIVLQNRVLDLARRLDCTLRIESKNQDSTGDQLPTFEFSGNGSPVQALEFLRYLERGEHRARFEELNLVYEEISAEAGIDAFFSGVFTIPQVPVWDSAEEEDGGEEIATSDAEIETEEDQR